MSDDTKREVQRWRELAEKATRQWTCDAESEDAILCAVCGHDISLICIDTGDEVHGEICDECAPEYTVTLGDALTGACDLVDALTARAETAERERDDGWMVALSVRDRVVCRVDDHGDPGCGECAACQFQAAIARWT